MNYQEKYELWKKSDNLDIGLREELEHLSKEEIEDAFYTDVEFQTAGMRGLMGVGTNRINIHTVRRATQGFANYLVKRGKGKIAIAYDNRFNSKEMAFDCAYLLASNGIESFIFPTLRPTPELSYTVRYYHCDGGIMITASHNPKEYNGYKLYDDTGCQLIPTMAAEVIEEINKLDDILGIKPKDDYDKSLIHIVGEEVDEAYYNDVLGIRMHKDVNKDFRIAFSPEHGTSCIPVETTLKRAGFDVHTVSSQRNPDPAFSNTKTPNPEERAAYDEVLSLAKEIDADLVLVCDPDGDRMGVGVKHHGQHVLLNGNQTGAVLIEYILHSYEDLGIKVDNPCIFDTVVTSDIGEEIARYHGCDCERTLTGFKYIGNKVRQYEFNHLKTYVFGYEESYGSLVSPFVRDKDATQACLMLSEACAYYLEKGMTLVDVLEDIYRKVGAFYDSQFSIMLPGADGAINLAKIMENLRDNPLVIPDFTIRRIEDYKLQKAYEGNEISEFKMHDVADVLKYYLSDGSFVAIRPSGTEPKCKIYLSCKDETIEKAKAKEEKLNSYLRSVIK